MSALFATASTWTADDEASLRALVAEHGSRWNVIGDALGRTGDACRGRWSRINGYSVRERPWTPEEDALIAAHEIGVGWGELVKQLNRTRSQLALRRSTLDRLARTKVEPKPAKRKCLRCKSTFQPENRYRFTCDPCWHTNQRGGAECHL